MYQTIGSRMIMRAMTMAALLSGLWLYGHPQEIILFMEAATRVS
jgi:hypothetical protein